MMKTFLRDCCQLTGTLFFFFFFFNFGTVWLCLDDVWTLMVGTFVSLWIFPFSPFRCLPGILFRDASMDERQLDRRNSSIFCQIAREFSSQWRRILDNLIGIRMRRELEQKRTLGEPLSPGDLVVEGLHDWSMKEECPTGQELYDCLLNADCPPGSLRDFLKKLKVRRSHFLWPHTTHKEPQLFC